jgi:hypothetical protein
MNKIGKTSENLINHQFKEFYMAELTNFERGEEHQEKRLNYIIKEFNKIYDLYGYRKFFNEILDYFFQFCIRVNDMTISIKVLSLIEK